MEVTEQQTLRINFELGPKDIEYFKGRLAKARKNGPVVSGIEMSGIVESDGSRFKRGDKDFGYTNIFKGPFYHAEYVAISEDKLAIVPDGVTLHGAASIVGGALTALAALERIAGLKSGENVLITGATGSVGTTAVQLAKHMGANVAGVCHSSQISHWRFLSNRRERKENEKAKEFHLGSFHRCQRSTCREGGLA